MKNLIIFIVISAGYILALPIKAEVSDWDAAKCGARKLLAHGGGFGLDPKDVDKLVKDKKIAEATLCINFANDACTKFSTEFADKAKKLEVFSKYPIKAVLGRAKLYKVTEDRCEFRYEPSNKPSPDSRVIFAIKKDK
jgi:hypothetical protein